MTDILKNEDLYKFDAHTKTDNNATNMHFTQYPQAS